MLGSIAASVEVDNFVDGSLHQTAIRDMHLRSLTGGCTATSYFQLVGVLSQSMTEEYQ